MTLFLQNEKKQWVQRSQTEIIWDTLNPNFLKTFLVDYYFEKQQNMRFTIVDRDENPNLVKEVGTVECTLGALFGS